MKKTDLKFERFDKVLELGKIYEPIKKEIMKEWEDWRNSGMSNRRDDNKINKLFNKLKKKCPFLYDTKRKEVYRIIKSLINKVGDHQIHYLYIKQEFDSEEFCTGYDNENNPVIGIRDEKTSEEIVKNCIVVDKEYFDNCLQKALTFFGVKDAI